MYLSQLILNPRSWSARRDLDHPYEMHQTIMRAFSKNLESGSERVLWRVDVHLRTKAPALLVQSLSLPDWSWVEEEHSYLLPVDEPNPAAKEFDLHPIAGHSFNFRLRANPTLKKVMPEKRQGRRVGIYHEEGQLAWLARKAELHGFSVLRVQVSRDGKIVNEKAIRCDDGMHKLELLSVQFDGVLQVTDHQKLLAAVKNGIGSGKGFGFGLLSLAPAPS